MPGSDAGLPIAAYLATVVDIRWDDDVTIHLSPADPGVTDGEFPDGVGAVHVVTAHNPGSRRLPAEENARRNARLEEALRERGWRHVPAVGRGTDPREDWSEEGFALVDAPTDEVLALARRFGQAAVYEWTPQARTVVLSDASVRWTQGWRALACPVAG